MANTLHRLGRLHAEQYRPKEARSAYDEALKIYRDLAEHDVQAYLPYVAMTQSDLGTLHRAQNRFDEAHAAYEEALAIYRRLAQSNPDIYSPFVANTLDHLSTLHDGRDRVKESSKVKKPWPATGDEARRREE